MSATPTPDSPPAASKKKKWIVLAALVLAGGGAAGAWWFTARNAHAGEAAHAPQPSGKTAFVSLDPFTVNLQDPRGDRFAQVAVTLEIDDAKVEVEIKDRLPAVRNNVLMLVSARQIEDLLTPEGKRQLAADIRDQVGLALGVPLPAATASVAGHADTAHKAQGARANPVRNVLFSQFIVQ